MSGHGQQRDGNTSMKFFVNTKGLHDLKSWTRRGCSAVLRRPGSITSGAVLARQRTWQLFRSLQAFMWTEVSEGAAYFISVAINKSRPNEIMKQK